MPVTIQAKKGRKSWRILIKKPKQLNKTPRRGLFLNFPSNFDKNRRSVMAMSAVFYIVTMTVSPKQDTLSSPGGCFVFLCSFLLCLYTCILFIFEILLTLFSFLWICSNLPLSSTYRLPPSPCPGTAYGFHSF